MNWLHQLIIDCDLKGDPVIAGDEVRLTAAGSTHQCLHASDVCLNDNPGSHEVHVSLQNGL